MPTFVRSFAALALCAVALAWGAWPHSETRSPRAEARVLNLDAFVLYDLPEEPVTTTTTTEPPVTTTQPALRPVQTSWPASLEPCGGVYPPCAVAWRESHGDYAAVNPSGFYGKWQFSQGTWNGIAARSGRGDLVGVRPDQASPADQDAMAAALWAGGSGCSHWASC